jgi:hypothetical protein
MVIAKSLFGIFGTCKRFYRRDDRVLCSRLRQSDAVGRNPRRLKTGGSQSVRWRGQNPHPIGFPLRFARGFVKTRQILVTPKDGETRTSSREITSLTSRSVERQIIGIDAAEVCGHVPAWRGAERRLIGRATDRGRYDCLACCARPSATGYGAERNSGIALAVPEKTSAHYRTGQRGERRLIPCQEAGLHEGRGTWWSRAAGKRWT